MICLCLMSPEEHRNLNMFNMYCRRPLRAIVQSAGRKILSVFFMSPRNMSVVRIQCVDKRKLMRDIIFGKQLMV